MAITVKHKFVSPIPDAGDPSIVQPSNWNDDHELTGTIPVANGGTGAATLTGYVKGNGTSAMTAVTTIPNTDITGLGTASTKNAGSANGVATLDSGGQVPLSQLPPLGDLNYQGTWNASTNTPTLTSSVGTKGYYYVVSVAGTTNLNGITDWQVNDWAVFNGSVWQKIDNTDAVTSVNGYTGTVVLTNTDISGFGTMSTQNANAVAITGGTINGATVGATTPAAVTGTTITAATGFVSENYLGLPSLGGNLKTNAGTSLLNWDGGGSGNVNINGGLNANPSNKNVSIAPTGTGTATINPATAGTMNNMVIGGTTPLAGSFTDLSVTGTTKFDGSEGTAGQVLTSAGTGNTPTWTTPTTGTVTSVTGTAPVVSSGGATPAISMAAATSSVNGYLTSTDWSTFNGKQAALVSGTNLKTVNGSSLLGSGDVGTIDVAHGGTGATSATAYAVLCGGTTSTGAHQSIASVGTSGQVLTSNGAGALPTFQNAAGSFPTGTALLFQQTAAPTGWTKQTTHDNKALRVVSGTASSGGSVAFTTAFASQSVSGSNANTTATNQSYTPSGSVGTSGATTLSTSQIPAHGHDIQRGGTQGAGGGSPYIWDLFPNSGTNYSATQGTGGGGSHTHSGGSFSGNAATITQDTHTHTFTGTAINLAVQYVDVIIATKD